MSTPDPASASADASESAAAATSAAERWVSDHGDLLWRFARSRLRNPHLAEEAVQETLLAAMESFGRYGGASSERTWLLGIAAHKIADCLRRERRAARDTTPPATESATESEPSPPPEDPFTPRGKWKRLPRPWPRSADSATTDGPSAGERAELLAALAACLEKLPPGIAEAIWLRDLLEMPADQVCQALGLSATNLWTKTHRGRMALRSCVEESLQVGSGRMQRGSDSAPSSPRPRDGGTRS